MVIYHIVDELIGVEKKNDSKKSSQIAKKFFDKVDSDQKIQFFSPIQTIIYCN